MPFRVLGTFVREAPQACKYNVCVSTLGFTKSCNLVSYFMESEVKDIIDLQKLAKSGIAKFLS